VALYIYRVGDLASQKSFYRYKSMKILNCTRTLYGPVRLVGRARPAGAKLAENGDGAKLAENGDGVFAIAHRGLCLQRTVMNSNSH